MPDSSPDCSQESDETSTFNMRQLAVRFLAMVALAVAEQSAANSAPGKRGRDDTGDQPGS